MPSSSADTDLRPTALVPVTSAGIDRAAARLRAGGLVAFPTETVYGLGADATSDEAVAALYAAKGRPRFNPLIIHVAHLQAALHYGVFNADALKLAHAFWPGPLTLVVPVRGERISLLARAGLDTVALRVPGVDVARALIAAAGVPVAAPSANRSGALSPTSARDVMAELDGRIDMVLDGKPSAIGLESSIVALRGGVAELLRPGAVALEDLRRIVPVHVPAAAAGDVHPSAPGQLKSHYAPRAGLRLHATSLRPGEVGLDFGGVLAGAARDLSPSGNLAEAAAHLFRALRDLDASGAQVIAMAPVPEHGLGLAINDRLARAAAPRDS
ncbi:MAG: threonylcarbamoyl-AMP synthase [Hyphomicrobiales bacterium]|nr:threonylcarbamoyl-AMP synthase [Hyphomicrobiales bacterium]